MKKIIIVCIAALTAITSFGQKVFTKTAEVYFDATSPSSPEKIEGINRSGTCVIDTKNGNMQFVALMKGFAFERALMEEHFNENYVESHKYPKAEFKGDLKNIDKVDFTKDGTYTLKVKGVLSLHGESKELETEAKFIVQNGNIKASTAFSVQLSDFKISIPGLVADKLSKTAKVGINCSLQSLKTNP